MTENEYNICLQTPIGPRYGKMRIIKEQNKLSGFLDILKQPSAFTGEIDGNGNCTIYGKLVTLIQTIPYMATGRIAADKIFFILQGGQGSFEINGIACHKEMEPTPCEKVL